ncbi:hypothetical protein SpCBS45565_g07673 [Spizellomyces sp. 'palustris']|nr:hypothetical protein SpCBS45565_g07673 [Spizellomyces sp. 'palustris']
MSQANDDVGNSTVSVEVSEAASETDASITKTEIGLTPVVASGDAEENSTSDVESTHKNNTIHPSLFFPPPPPSGTIAPGLPDEEDDFGEFGELPSSVGHGINGQFATADAVTPDVDDFGDFEDFAEPAQLIATPEAVLGSGPAEAEVEPPGDPQEEQRVSRILAGVLSGMSLQSSLNELNEQLALVYPIPTSPEIDTFNLPVESFFEEDERKPESGDNTNNGKTIAPHSAFQNEAWYAVWKKLSSDTVFTETVGIKFRWRRSHIRRAFLATWDININVEEPSGGPLISAPGRDILGNGTSSGPGQATAIVRQQSHNASPGDRERSKPPKDARESELAEARKLCDIPEDEIRKKTVEELAELVQMLTVYHQKMQDQANYWLDSKEQLIMDAEMHNKMIASLVQYAQQQQTAPKGQRSTSPGKKGKPSAKR